jgi:hypothetical protein
MKAFLMQRARDFDPKQALPPNEQNLRKDLELETIFAAMAGGDELVQGVAVTAILTATENDVATTRYRQEALKDAVRNPEAVRDMYGLAGEAIQRQKKVWPRFREYPNGRLDNAVEAMGIFVDVLIRLRRLADQGVEGFDSDAFRNLFMTLQRELSDDYFHLVDGHLKALKFRNGVLVSAKLGRGLKGTDYVLRSSPKLQRNWFAKLFGDHPRSYSIFLAPRDEAGAQAMSELRDRGLGLAANALAKSAEHVLSFFQMLRTELAFYVGCLNLNEKLLAMDAPFSYPDMADAESVRFRSRQLYDITLALTKGARPVGNDIEADGKTLIIVTGANQGGKTTFLRSFGGAQLMAQAGMFVAADHLETSAVDGVFTHFKQEEDATMKSGKFDEELSRMNDIVNALTPSGMVLFNESFSATNEREGSEIARQIVSGLLERRHRLVFVSHQYDFTHSLYERGLAEALFLRADRQDDGTRTFRLVEAPPLATSFGEDVYLEVFGEDQVMPEPAAV